MSIIDDEYKAYINNRLWIHQIPQEINKHKNKYIINDDFYINVGKNIKITIKDNAKTGYLEIFVHEKNIYLDKIRFIFVPSNYKIDNLEDIGEEILKENRTIIFIESMIDLYEVDSSRKVFYFSPHTDKSIVEVITEGVSSCGIC